MLEKNVKQEINEFIKPLISEFSRQCNSKLIRVEETWENGFSETSYIFNDGLGGYTFKGLIDSLEKSYELN